MSLGSRVQHQRGFSLVELMIAVALGITLVGLVLPAFIGNVQGFNFNAGVARTQETARAVLTELTHDIRMLGFSGCNSKRITLTNQTSDNSYNLVPGLLGYENASAITLPGIDSSAYSIAANSDAITVKYLNDARVLVAAPVSSATDTITVRPGHTLAAGDVIFIGNCESGVVTELKSVTNTTLTLQAPLSTARPYGSRAQIYKVDVVTYFLAASQMYVNNRSQVPNSLWRKINSAAPRELVVGVEALRLQYGLDSNGDGAVNQFKTADQLAGQMQNVAVVRLQLVTSSIDAVGTEGVISRPITLSVSLRNKSAG